MTSDELLGPIVTEPRKKFRIMYAPDADLIDFKMVFHWVPETLMYEVIDGAVINIPGGEFLDCFETTNEDGDYVYMFARQFDDRLFMLNIPTIEGAMKKPGEGNNQSFYLEQLH